MTQTGLFTNEEMTGTGQMNMLNAIDHQEDRTRTLRKTVHHFHSDAGHGWLEVELADLAKLGISHAISHYSYRHGDKAYLEEDMDATTYVNALFPNRDTDPEWPIFHDRMRYIDDDGDGCNSPIRRYAHYK
jgi:hypothetical protein